MENDKMIEAKEKKYFISWIDLQKTINTNSDEEIIFIYVDKNKKEVTITTSTQK